MFKKTYCAIVATAFVLAACSSNDNNTTLTSEGAGDAPVTDVTHIIQPDDVDTFIANFQAQQSRLAFTFDGVNYPLTFLDLDSNNNVLIAEFNENDLVFIGFDLEEFEPLPSMTVAEIADDDETVTRLWESTTLSLQETLEEDYEYSGRLQDPDSDSEVDVNLVFNESLVTAGTSTITVSSSDALLNGDMGTQTYIQMQEMIMANPEVTRLVIQQSTGSVNDAINVHTGRLIRAANLATHVPADGDINSGAVDLFAAGVTRTVEPGGILGVHSWCCEDGVTADELPVSHPAHGAQLTYFREMLADNGEDFYFFTLQAAPFDGIHAMTREEMTQFGVITE